MALTVNDIEIIRREIRDALQIDRRQKQLLASIKQKLEEIVCTEGCDTGVILLSQEGTTHWDPEHKCQVYDHEYFSPLGDALIELYKLVSGPESPPQEPP